MAKKILVVSDTHGNNTNLRKVLANMQDCMDLMIHLGDSNGSPENLKDLVKCPVEMVRGNCDSYMYKLPATKLVEVEGMKLFLTHGNQYGGGRDLEQMREAARENGCQVVMFGHTHEPLVDTCGDVAVINPGSLSQPRQEGHRPTYLVMNINDDGRVEYNVVTL